jgi:Zn-dependent protease
VLVEPPRTNYDLNFRLFLFPVRVHPFFWLGSILINGWVIERLGVVYMLMWVAAVFLSILVHELGHALAFRRFGVDSHIVLYVFGGLAVPWADVPGKGRRVVIALAGPVAGFILCGLLWGSNQLAPWVKERPFGQRWDHVPTPLEWFYDSLIWVNLFWGLFNLLPVYPLDGGQVSKEVCSSVWGRRGPRVALQISMVVAGLMAVYGIACAIDPNAAWLRQLPGWFPVGTLWMAILFGMLAVQSYQLLQQTRWTDSHWAEDDDRPPWRR